MIFAAGKRKDAPPGIQGFNPSLHRRAKNVIVGESHEGSQASRFRGVLFVISDENRRHPNGNDVIYVASDCPRAFRSADIHVADFNPEFDVERILSRGVPQEDHRTLDELQAAWITGCRSTTSNGPTRDAGATATRRCRRSADSVLGEGENVNGLNPARTRCLSDEVLSYTH